MRRAHPYINVRPGMQGMAADIDQAPLTGTAGQILSWRLADQGISTSASIYIPWSRSW